MVIDVLILCFCEDYALNKGWDAADSKTSSRRSKAKSGGEYACPHRLYNLLTVGTRGPADVDVAAGQQRRGGFKLSNAVAKWRARRRKSNHNGDQIDPEEGIELRQS
jgi:hypothetical protein